jgi:Ca2+:H+ antiporter
MEKQKSFENLPINNEETSTSSSAAVVNKENTQHKSLLLSSTTNSSSSSIKSRKGGSKKRISTREGLMVIVKSSWINVLLVFVPVGIASHFVWSPTITFIMNFLAIVPLAKLLGFATEDIALRTGEVSKRKKEDMIQHDIIQ